MAQVGSGIENRYFSIVYGYRSLIDWQSTEDFYRGGGDNITPQGRELSTNFFSKRVSHEKYAGINSSGVGGGSASGGAQASGLTGPRVFGLLQAQRRGAAAGALGKRPLEWQGAGRTKIPFGPPGNARGMFWSVRNEQPRPNFSSGQIGDIFDALDEYSQQWLYLAGEKLSRRAVELEERGDYPTETPDERETRIRFLVNKDSGLSGMGGSMGPDNQVFEMMKGGKKYKSVADKYGTKIKHDNKVINPFSARGYKARRKLAKEQGDPVFPEKDYSSDYVEYEDSSEMTDAQKSMFGENADELAVTKKDALQPVFKRMFGGMQSQWMTTFMDNVYKRGEPSLTTISGYIVNAMSDWAQGIDAQTIAEALRTGRELPTGTGITGQEMAMEVGGMGTAPPEDPELYRGSKPIDVEFIEEVYLEQGGRVAPGFSRGDLTTDFFTTSGKGEGGGKKWHHGTGPGRVMGMVYKSIDEAREDIKTYYNSDVLPLYNNLIKMILKVTGKKTLYEARGEMGKLGKNFSNWKKTYAETVKVSGNLGHAKGKKFETTATRIKKGSDDALTQLLSLNSKAALQSVSEHSLEELFWQLKWIMHQAGNMLPNRKNDSFGNIMPITVAGEPHTLILVYDLKSNGEYKDFNGWRGGSFVYIESGMPLKWLYERSDHKRKGLSLDQFIQDTNAALVASGLEAGARSGQLNKLLARQSAGLEVRAGISQVVEPEFAADLNRITSLFFTQIAAQMDTNLARQVHDEAVRFSKQERSKKALPQVYKWWKMAIEQLMSATAAEYPEQEYGNLRGLPQYTHADADPFWFLWAAPYVTAGYTKPPGGGFATQTK